MFGIRAGMRHINLCSRPLSAVVASAATAAVMIVAGCGGTQVADGDEEAFPIHRGQFVPGRQRDDQIAMKRRGPARWHDQTAIRSAREGRDGALDLAGAEVTVFEPPRHHVTALQMTPDQEKCWPSYRAGYAQEFGRRTQDAPAASSAVRKLLQDLGSKALRFALLCCLLQFGCVLHNVGIKIGSHDWRLGDLSSDVARRDR
jgi:hypothetical protein